ISGGFEPKRFNQSCSFVYLGGGNFGQVVKGIYRTPHGQEVPVAVKTLKESQIASTGEQSILSEAKMMTQLKHRHIVRLIGVCKAQRFMLVLELAPLGPINKFLKKHPQSYADDEEEDEDDGVGDDDGDDKEEEDDNDDDDDEDDGVCEDDSVSYLVCRDTSVNVITDLMYQVAQGMAYLESCKFVHRDLAARNVLLVTQRFAKISDFGMSKALNFGNDYYRVSLLSVFCRLSYFFPCQNVELVRFSLSPLVRMPLSTAVCYEHPVKVLKFDNLVFLFAAVGRNTLLQRLCTAAFVTDWVVAAEAQYLCCVCRFPEYFSFWVIKISGPHMINKHNDLAAPYSVSRLCLGKIASHSGSMRVNNSADDSEPHCRAASAGKWPLKWYAPECIYYFRFDSKSDVWSYGITLWEVFSFGERPYKHLFWQDMKGAQILSMLDQGLRLSRPARCPEAVYAVMRECWNFEGVRRPTFAELVLTMSRLSKSMLSSSSSSTTKEGSTAFPPPPSGFEPVSCKSSVIPSATGSSGGSGVNSSASDMAFF
ncbi:unnamed protein product, partial [Schistocephalus solidus]|uniref:Protein kinase domain-containing protein n=2 Tax=Schistocephalus solidus TaxID=70667 RepID=A0A183T919_SCHSO